jgi:hypothetical protein
MMSIASRMPGAGRCEHLAGVGDRFLGDDLAGWVLLFSPWAQRMQTGFVEEE